MRKLGIILLLLLLPVLMVTAQQAWYVKKPIVEVRFEGLHNVSKTDLSNFTDQFTGKLYTDSLFKDMQSKLFALDYFKKFRAEAEPGDPEKKSVIIIFSVEEKPVVGNIVIDGNKNVSDGDILDAILLKKDDIFSKTKLRADEKAIMDMYLDKGYPDVSVASESAEDEDSKLVKVTFTIEEGYQTRVKEIAFSGNNFATDSTLKGLLSTKEQKLLKKGVFKNNLLEEDKKAIVKYYADRGYVDAKVVEIKKDLLESEKDRNFLKLTYYIEEGEQWFFEGIYFKGNTLFSNDTLREKVLLKDGDILNQSKLIAGYTKITDLYYNDGYIFNDIKIDQKRDSRERAIAYTVTVVEKERAHIENILIKGNVKTKDHVIYREIPLTPGDVFSKDKVIEGVQNLYNTGLFSTINPETPYGSAEGLMDLVLNVEEAKNTDIQFGITFTGAAGTFPVVGFLKWNDRNFRGEGQNLNIGTELSTNKQNLTLGFMDNWLMGKRWSAGINFSFEHLLNENIKQDIMGARFSEDEYNNGTAAPDPYNSYDEWKDAIDNGETIDSSYLMQYDSLEFATGINTGYTFHTPVGRVTTGTGLKTSFTRVHYDPEVYRPYNPAIRNNLDTWLFNNKLWLNLGWDTRDFVMNPGKGFFFNEIFTYAGGFIGGRSNYLKTQSKAEGFFTLLDVPVSDTYTFKTILALHTAYSAVLPQYYSSNGSWTTGVEATTNDLLFTDGMTIARGWPWMQDGEAMWDNWIELRMPVSERVLWSDIFLSGTGFWNQLNDVKSMNISDFKFSMGAGIRFVIPGLPIGLYFTKRFSFDDNSNIQWEGGSIFRSADNPGSGLDLVIAFTTGMF